MKQIDLNRVAREAQHSQKSLDKLFHKIYPMIWHYYKIRVNSQEDAEDLTQNACMKVVKNLHRFDEKKGAFISWMYRVIQNMLYDFFRLKKLPMEDLDIQLLDETTTPLDEIIKEEDRIKLKEALKNIGARQREILEMKYFFYMKNKEIAKTLDIKEKTVSSLVCRAIESLQNYFKSTKFSDAKGMVYEKD